MTPKVSIIVPVYNAGKFIRRCVDSILSQSLKEIEVILVDDGSTDDADTICDNYKLLDDRVVVIHQVNSGVSAARNRGIDIARGEYIGFVDADDYIEENMYEIMYSYAVENKVDVCCCGFYREEKDNQYIKHCKKNIVYKNIESFLKDYFRQDIEIGIGSGNWNKIFRKSLIGNDKYLSYTNGEDIEFQVRQFLKSKTVSIVSDALYHYMCSDNELSATNKALSASYFGILDSVDVITKEVANRYSRIENELYAFRLTWYASAIQKICVSDNAKDVSLYRKKIKKEFLANFNKYIFNKYTKRLDVYYMCASVIGCTNLAYIFRNQVIAIKSRISKKL